MYTKGQIREFANQALEDSGFDGQFPVPVDKIIEKFGFSFKGIRSEDAPPAFCGMVDHKNKTVVINQSHSNGRKRFTAAHELGHIILHPDEDNVDYRISFNNPSPKETEAHQFAAEILMPYDEFLKIYNRYNGDFRYISKYFDVSIGAATIRAESLGL